MRLGFLGLINFTPFGIGWHNLKRTKNAEHPKMTARMRGNQTANSSIPIGGHVVYFIIFQPWKLNQLQIQVFRIHYEQVFVSD